MSALADNGNLLQRSFRVTLQNPAALPVLRDRKIVFHGINKSSSGSLAKVLGGAYRDAGRRAELHTHYRNGDVKDVTQLKRLIETLPAPGLFVGHYLYGCFDLPRDMYSVVSVFRHPLPRTISIHQWLKRKAAKAGGNAAAFPSLEEWVRRNGGKSKSQMIHFAAPFDAARIEVIARHTAPELLAMAKENVERDVACVGMAEYFEETIFLFAHLCGLNSVRPWHRDNRNTGRTMAWDIPQSTQDLIRDVYSCDFEFYEWIKQRFTTQVQAAGIAGDIAAYKAACAAQYKDRLVEAEVLQTQPVAPGMRERLKQRLAGLWP